MTSSRCGSLLGSEGWMNSFLLLVVCVLVHPHTQHALAAAGTGVAQRQQGGGSLIQGSCTALQFPPFDGGCKSGDEVASPMRCRLRGGGEGNDVAPTTGQELYNIAEERFASIVRAKRAGEGKGGGGISSCIKWLARTIGGSEEGSVSARNEALEATAEMFIRAANKFKLLKKWRQAGDALLRSGDCYSRHTELQFEASNRYQEAGTAFKQEDVSLAVRALRRAAAISTDVEDAVNFQRAARLYRDVGDMLEASGNTTAAEEEYERAHSLFQAEGVKMEADSMSVRVADCACRRGAFEKARTAYEELAANAIRSETKTAGGREAGDHLMKAGMCLLCLGDLAGVDAALARYGDLDPTFDQSWFGSLLVSLKQAVQEADVEAFNKQVRDCADSITTDAVMISFLTRLKAAVMREGAAGETIAAREEEEDDQDLL